MQKKKHKFLPKLLPLLAVIFLFISSFQLQADDLKIRVIVKTANIRLKPSLDSPVIGKALNGQVFTVLKKIGDWYSITLPPDEKGIVISGFIHQSVVEELIADIPKQIQKEEAVPEKKPAATEKKEPPSPPVSSKPPIQKEHEPPSRPSRNKFFVRLSGGYASKTYTYGNSWAFTLYHEDGQVKEDYEINSSGVTFDGGVGFLFIRNMGIEISFIPATGKTKGSFSASFPHPLYFNYPREKIWENTGLKYSASEINLNLIYTLPLFSKLHVYLTLGGTYFAGVKIENLKVINWNETGYPYFDLNVSPQYSLYSKNNFGFNAGGGIDFFFADNFGLNANIRYSEGEAKIDVEGTTFSIKTGGLRATAGIKLTF